MKFILKSNLLRVVKNEPFQGKQKKSEKMFYSNQINHAHKNFIYFRIFLYFKD